MSPKPTRPGRGQAEAFADRLRQDAMRKMLADPYAQPYWPTSAAVRQMCTRLAAKAVVELGPGASEEERELARRRGPALAIEWMAGKAASVDRAYSEAQQDAEHARKRHWRGQRRAQRDREARRSGLSAGQRIDKALTELSAIASAPAGKALDQVQMITGKSESPGPMFPGDPAAKARAVVAQAVRVAEDELENARRRRVELEKVA